MAIKRDEGILAWVVSIVTFAGIGYAAGLRALVWLLYSVIAFLWMALFMNSIDEPHRDGMFWIVTVGPVIVIGIVLKIIEGVIAAIIQAANDSKNDKLSQLEGKQN